MADAVPEPGCGWMRTMSERRNASLQMLTFRTGSLLANRRGVFYESCNCYALLTCAMLKSLNSRQPHGTLWLWLSMARTSCLTAGGCGAVVCPTELSKWLRNCALCSGLLLCQRLWASSTTSTLIRFRAMSPQRESSFSGCSRCLGLRVIVCGLLLSSSSCCL